MSSAIEQGTTVESEPSLYSEQTKATDTRISRTSILKQRLRILEKKIKEKKKQNKMWTQQVYGAADDEKVFGRQAINQVTEEWNPFKRTCS